ncbi:MAG: hypothetical protein LIP01_15690 [Tannerellaceae bacterium]|nr:hypothetical protein [Tannerellaceae bacterium]
MYSDNTLILKSITFPDGSLTFNYNGDRADRRKYRLTSIALRNKSELLRTFYLGYSYFSNTGIVQSGQTGPAGNYSENYTLRLKLDYVSTIESTTGKEIKYNFDYYTTKLLPPYYDVISPYNSYYSQDYWGYYNGASNSYLLTYYNAPNLTLTNYPEAKRDVNIQYAQACVLNKITYPTGGHTVFEYESNRNYQDKEVGGLRIKNIVSYDDPDTAPVVKSYEYGGVRENTTAYVGEGKGTSYTQGKIEGSQVTIYDHYLSEPVIPLSFRGGSSVFYQKVTEFEGCPDASNGKTEYSFYYQGRDANTIMIGHCNLPSITAGTFHPYLGTFYEDGSWSRDFPTRTDIYKKEGNEFSLVKRTEYEYRILDSKNVKVGFRAFAYFDTTQLNLPYPFNAGTKRSKELFQYGDVHVQTGLVKLSEVKETLYTEKDSIVDTTTYFYNNMRNQYEVSAIHKKRSDGSLQKTSFLYPNDLKSTQAIYQEMAQENRISPVIIQTDSLDNQFLESIETAYKRFSPTLIAPATENIKRGNNPAETETSYNRYDETANIMEITQRNDVNQTIIWGYNKNSSGSRF